MITGTFPHNVPFTDRISTWHPQIIFHCFLGLSCSFVHFHYGRMSTPRVVCAIAVVVSDFCNGTINNKRWLESLGNCPYPGGYCSSSHPKSLSIFHNQLTWVEMPPETYWWLYHSPPLHRYCWFPHVSWPCIFIAHILRWLSQTSSSRIWWVRLPFVIYRKFPPRPWL